MWIWMVAVAGNHISAAMLRPSYELRLRGFENKHTSQIEQGDTGPEISPKIISNLSRLIHFSSTHIWSRLSIYNTRVLVSAFLWQTQIDVWEAKGDSLYSVYLHSFEKKTQMICCLFAFIYMCPLCSRRLDGKLTHQKCDIISKNSEKSQKTDNVWTSGVYLCCNLSYTQQANICSFTNTYKPVQSHGVHLILARVKRETLKRIRQTKW